MLQTQASYSVNFSLTNKMLSIAPMMDWTDRHCRFFHRLMSQHVVLYTEMVTTGALIHGNHRHLLQYNPEEHPLALQLGGSDPRDLALCAKIGEDMGYDEINLNVGCPSDRVQNGRFGACLMAEPELVAACIAAMQSAVALPVTVKCRIGIDHDDSYGALFNFVRLVSQAGCSTFIVHARKAWLNGYSPKQNREIPPLRYDKVFQLKQDFPRLNIILNGGITTWEEADSAMSQVDGVMVGREAYHNPYILADIDRRFFNAATDAKSRYQIIEQLIPYIQRQLASGTRLHSITRHVLGLFHGQPGARAWRRHLSENGNLSGANERVILEALKLTLH